MLTKDFMALLPSLLPLPKVNTLCENRNKDYEYHFNIKKWLKVTMLLEIILALNT
jgi:hypothetical protein